ncbi:MAG TPA: hypothetical protein VGU61_13955 [Noviherbaspirillum sp.]|jgi:hypothetical protein|uniref:hypothetical protein n=1 Tax=Noviherbaspirillum sp. TaxID=1926288 RepID=UPI002DDDB930|nr:hypothetical protein [Noviherbaspirillum sp.]HEV2611368.1 hypothetical protein [Noviherbaspirillum sp.]
MDVRINIDHGLPLAAAGHVAGPAVPQPVGQPHVGQEQADAPAAGAIAAPRYRSHWARREKLALAMTAVCTTEVVATGTAAVIQLAKASKAGNDPRAFDAALGTGVGCAIAAGLGLFGTIAAAKLLARLPRHAPHVMPEAGLENAPQEEMEPVAFWNLAPQILEDYMPAPHGHAEAAGQNP